MFDKFVSVLGTMSFGALTYYILKTAYLYFNGGLSSFDGIYALTIVVVLGVLTIMAAIFTIIFERKK